MRKRHSSKIGFQELADLELPDYVAKKRTSKDVLN